MPCSTTLTARSWSVDGYGNYMIPMESGASSTYTFDDFFSNSDSINCPVANCQIFEGSTCNDVIDPSIASLQSTFPYDLTINHGASYLNKLCYQCETTCCADQVSSTMDYLIIMDLLNQKSTQPGPYRFPQDVSSSDMSIESTFQNFFDINSITVPCVNDDSTTDSYGDTCTGYYDNDPSVCSHGYCISPPNFDCNVQCCACKSPTVNTYDTSAHLSCGMFNQGCLVAHTSADISVDPSSPFGVTAKQDTPSGYDYTLCYKCTYQSVTSQGAVKSIFEITYDNWVISQDNPACIGALTPIDWSAAGKCFQVGSSSYQILNPNGISDIFQNVDSSQCPIRECQLSRGTACANSNSVSETQISNGPQFTIQITNSLPSFTIYVSNPLCIECQIGSLNYNNQVPGIYNEDILKPIAGHADFNVSAAYAGLSSPTQAFRYLDVFTNDRPASCVPWCQIYETDCVSTFSASASEIYIESSSPYKIRYFKNVQAGFSYNGCLKCSFDIQTPLGTSIFQTEQTKQFTITVSPDPAIYCQNALTPIPWNSDIFLNSEPNTVDTIINPDGWKNFFTNFDEVGCQIQSCQLFSGSSCSDPISPTFAEVSSASPFFVTIHQQYYDSQINENPWCIKCTTSSPSIYTFQNILSKVDTGPILSEKVPPFGLRYLKQNLSDSSPTQVSSSYLDFLDNQEPQNCPPTRCFLLEQDCLSPFQNTTLVSMQSSFPFGIHAQINKNPPYTFDLCTKCEFDTVIPVTTINPSQQVVQTKVVTSVWRLKLVNCNDRQVISVVVGCYQCANYEKAQEDNSCGPDKCDFKKDILLFTGYCYECGEGSLPDEVNRKCVLLDGSVVNIPPMFVHEISLPEAFKIEEEAFEFWLPEIEDMNMNFESFEIHSESLGSLKVSNQIEEKSQDCLIYFDQETRIVRADLSNSNLMELKGPQRLSLILTDSEGAQSKYDLTTEFVLEVEQEDDKESNQLSVFKVSDKALIKQAKADFEQTTFSFTNISIVATPERPPITLFKSEFTSTGLLTLDFSEELFPIDSFLQDNKTLAEINENIEMLINITYYCQLDHDEEGIDGVKLEDLPVLKSYKVQSYSDQYLQFKLEFSSPLFVSSLPTKDFISVQILTHQLFMAKKDFLLLSEGYEIKHIAVPPQFLNDKDAERMERLANQAQNGLLATFIIPFVFMLFARVSLDRVWAMYYTLQLMTNMQNYMQLLIPANSLKILNIITNVVCFRLLTNKEVQRFAKKYVFGEKTKWLKDILMDQGADVTQQVLFFTVLLGVIIGLQFKCTKEKCEEERKQMVWSGWLRGKITLYLPTSHLIFSHIQALIYLELDTSSNTDTSKRFLQPSNQSQTLNDLSIYQQSRLYFKSLILILLPFFSYFLLKRNFQKLQDPVFKQKYGTLFMNLNTSKPQVLTFTSLFCLKRLVISFFTVFLNGNSFCNIFVNIFLALMFVKYLLDNEPMEFRYLNRLEIMNESFLIFFNYFLFMFTVWTGDVQVRYQLGFVFVYIIVFVMGVNMVLISRSMYEDSIFLHKKQKAEKAWHDYAKLKVKMANFLAHEKAKQEGKLNNQFIRKQRKEIHKSNSYKEMETQIIEIFEERKRKSKAAILNSLLKFSLKSVSKNIKEENQTPRFGSNILAIMEKIEKSEEPEISSSESSSSSSQPSKASHISSDLSISPNNESLSNPQQPDQIVHQTITNQDQSLMKSEDISLHSNHKPLDTLENKSSKAPDPIQKQTTKIETMRQSEEPTAFYEVEIRNHNKALQLKNQMTIMREYYAHQKMVRERGFEDPYDTFDISKDIKKLYYNQ